MNNLTEAQLNSKTKGELASICLDLQNRLVAASAGPTTPAEIERRNLDLQKQVILVKDAAEERAVSHEKKLAEIKANTEVSIKKLELEYNSGLGIDAEDLKKQYEDLEETAKKAIADLSFGLKEAELDARAKLEAIQKEVEKAESEATSKIEEYTKAISKASEDSKSSITSIKTNHAREVEQLQYDNSVAIRDENLKVAEQIAAKHDKVVVLKAEYEDLKEHKSLDEETVQTIITDAVNAKSKEIYASEGAKLGKLKSETDQEIALLKKDKDYLTGQVAQLQARVDSLEDQVKAHPESIAKAVQAAKADIVVNQDAAGKR